MRVTTPTIHPEGVGRITRLPRLASPTIHPKGVGRTDVILYGLTVDSPTIHPEGVGRTTQPYRPDHRDRQVLV